MARARDRVRIQNGKQLRMRRRKSAAESEAEMGMGRAVCDWIRAVETNGLDRVGKVASKMDQDGS